MKIFNIVLSLVALALTASLLFSCESSKIAYGNSYYFKQSPKKLSSTSKAPVADQLVASTEIKSPETSSVEEKINSSLTDVLALAKKHEKLENKIHLEKEALTRVERKSFRQERRENKREMRKELKKLVREYRSAPDAVKEKLSNKEVTGNLRTGIIIGAVGLILLIIGGPVLYPVGAILLVVGLVFILLDVI